MITVPAHLSQPDGPPRALVVGEALVDVVQHPDGSRQEHPGGSPANVALGLARLGRPVDLLTWLADDPHGDLVRTHLGTAGVRVVSGDRRPDRTPVAVAHLDEAGHAQYEFDLTWQLPGWDGPTPLVVHTGSIGAALAPGGQDVARLVADRRAGSTITYDPNLRPAVLGAAQDVRPDVEHLVGLSDVVKVSDEDLGWLFPGTDPLAVARDWAGRGPALVVVTFGGDGARAVTARGDEIAAQARPVTVADTVGAGDSFMSGLVDGLWSAGLLGADARDALHAVPADVVQRVLDRCARIAAITVSRPGANPPTSAELG